MIPAINTVRDDVAPPFFRLRCALSYCAPLLVNGIALPFFPVWLSSLNFDDHQIGIIVAVPMVVRVVVTPVVAMLADRLEERADVLLWSGALSLLTAIALFWTSTFWPVLLVYALQGGTYCIYVPIVESITLSGVRRWGIDYGSIRVWGSIAFIVSTMIGGELIGGWGSSVVLPAMVGGFVLTTLVAFCSPRIGATRRRAKPIDLKVPIGSALRSPQLLLTMIGVSVQQASHAILYTFASIYWHQLGFSGTQVGILWSIAVTSEVMVFFLSRWLSRRLSAWTLIRFGSAVSIVRWMLFPVHFGFWGYFALQCLHSFSFAFVHMGMQQRIVATVEEAQEASAQGAYYFYTGLFLGLMTFASGYIYALFGVFSFYVMAAVAVAGLAMVIVAFYLQPQSSAVGGKTSDAS